MKRILVTGSGGPAGVNFLMSLRISGEKMYIVGTDVSELHLYHAKPFLDATYKVPKCAEESYIDVINEIIEKEKIDLVYAQPDIEVRKISDEREKINANIHLPSKRTIIICQDKYLSCLEWMKKGLNVPKTIEIRRNHLEDDIRRAFDELGSPIWIRAKHGAGGRGSTPAHNEETALNWVKYWYSRGVNWEFIAQEYLPGRNIAFQSVFHEGEVVVSQARERLEYIYPHLSPSGITGTPEVSKTIHDDKVNEIATEAVLAIDENATGIFCVDLKEGKNGEIYPTEINAGRFFTTSFFFAYAGKVLNVWYANMPYIYVKLAFGERVENVQKYNILPEGIYWIRHIDCGITLLYEREGIEKHLTLI